MDVAFLERVFAAPGPYATVCADVTHDTENADTEVELRVRAIAGKLTEQGAPEAVVSVVQDRLHEANGGGEAGTLRGRALVVASDAAVVLDQPLVDAPMAEIAEWAPQPDLLPVLRRLPGRVPHVVVPADRVGADITYVSSPGQVIESETVEGDSFRIRKFQGGGWAHHRYQHNTENTWVHNAEDVARTTTSMVRRLSPRFVLVAGDVRARQILADRAGDLWSDLVVSMDEAPWSRTTARCSRRPSPPAPPSSWRPARRSRTACRWPPSCATATRRRRPTSDRTVSTTAREDAP